MPNYKDPGPGLSGSAELCFTERSSFHSHNSSNETIDKTKSSTGYPIKLVELPGSSTLNDQWDIKASETHKMHYWVRASSSDFGGTLPQPRRYSLSVCLSAFTCFSSFFLYWLLFLGFSVVTQRSASANRRWSCSVVLWTRSFSAISWSMILVLFLSRCLWAWLPVWFFSDWILFLFLILTSFLVCFLIIWFKFFEFSSLGLWVFLILLFFNIFFFYWPFSSMWYEMYKCLLKMKFIFGFKPYYYLDLKYWVWRYFKVIKQVLCWSKILKAQFIMCC